MKIFIELMVFVLLSAKCFAQDTARFYYDSALQKAAVQNAIYVEKIFTENDYLHSNLYWLKEGKIKSTGYYKMDENFTPIKEKTEYYLNGNRDVVTTFGSNGRISQYDNYYENGNNCCHVEYDSLGRVTAQSGWDEAGAELSDFNYNISAQFPGNYREWILSTMKTIEKKAAKNAAQKSQVNNAAKTGGNLTALVRFTVEADGSISHVYIEKDPGYGIGAELLKVFQSMKKWKPAQKFNRNVAVEQNQRFTFVIENED